MPQTETVLICDHAGRGHEVNVPGTRFCDMHDPALLEEALEHDPEDAWSMINQPYDDEP